MLQKKQIKQMIMKYSDDEFEVMAGSYTAEFLDTTSIPYEHGFIKGFVAGCVHLQNLQQTDVIGCKTVTVSPAKEDLPF